MPSRRLAALALRARARARDRGARDTPGAPWSPYGLERHRVALLRRRNRAILLALLLCLGALGAVLLSSIRSGSDVFVLNGDGSKVTIDVPEPNRPKPLTLSVSPGRTTVLERPIQPEQKPRGAPGPDASPDERGLNWVNLISALAPPVLIAVGAARYAKRRFAGPLEQVNLGVYKGALPLELLTAQHRKYVFTGRHAHASLFGKGREAHLPAQPMVVARR